MACINHEPLKIRLINHRFQHFLPNPLVSPAAETPLNRVPMTIFRRQVSPRRACPQYPEHTVQELPRIFCVAAPCPLISYSIWLEKFPHCIRHIMPSIAIFHDDTPVVFLHYTTLSIFCRQYLRYYPAKIPQESFCLTERRKLVREHSMTETAVSHLKVIGCDRTARTSRYEDEAGFANVSSEFLFRPRRWKFT